MSSELHRERTYFDKKRKYDCNSGSIIEKKHCVWDEMEKETLFRNGRWRDLKKNIPKLCEVTEPNDSLEYYELNIHQGTS